MHVTAGEGVSLTGEFVVTADHQGAPGLAHGGLLTAAFDETLGMLMWLLRTPAVTARLETDFRRPVPVGSTLHIAAHASAVQGRKVFTEAVGRLGGPDGPLAVRARALFVQVAVAHFTRTGGPRTSTPYDVTRACTAASEAFEVNP